jgi:hypothetical protein
MLVLSDECEPVSITPAPPIEQAAQLGESGGAGNGAFHHFPSMTVSAPKVLRRPVDLHIELVQVPLPMAMGAHGLDALAADLGGELRANPVPPVSHCLMADLDAPLMHVILDEAQ